MHARAVLCLATAALAAPGCGGDDEAAGPPAQPDVYVPETGPAVSQPDRPAPRPREPELECVRPGARDAGDAPPSREDPRTLLLRLRDLPKGFGFNADDQNGGVYRLPLTEVGDALRAAVEAADAELGAAVGHFGLGDLPPPPQHPAAPPPPASCPVPETEVMAAAVVASTPYGARGLYRVRSLLAGSLVGFGEGPIHARERPSPAPVAVGEQAELIEREWVQGHTARMIVWRDGRIVALVVVRGDRGRSDLALLSRLARRQAGYVRAAR